MPMVKPGGTGPLIIGVTTAQCILALVFVALRSWARIRLLGGFRYDDYLLWAAMFLLIAITGDSIAAVYHGLGLHEAEFDSKEQVIELSAYLFAYPVLLAFSLFVSKAAVVAFLLMIVVDKLHKIILWISISILGLLAALEVIGLFVQCVPFQANINPYLPKECHFDVDMVAYFLTGYGAFLDFFLAALPWYFLSSLQIKRKEKITICVSLSAGILAGVCGIIRLAELTKLQNNPDRVYGFYGAIIWCSTETSVSLICVCFPATRTLYRRYVKGLGSSTDSNGVTTGRQLSKYGYTLQDRSRNTQTDANTRSNANMESRNKTTVTGNAGGGRRSKQLTSKDSEESILGEEFLCRQMGIKQTTSVTVDYESEVGVEAIEMGVLGNPAEKKGASGDSGAK